MKIITTDKKVIIEKEGKSYTAQLGSILCEKTDDGITLLIDRVTLCSNFSQITVNGTKLTGDNADELLDTLFKLGNVGGVSLPIEIADVNNLQTSLDKKADLGDDGLVVAWQIPSTLDQIIEGELINDTDFDVDGFIIEPENSKIYVDTLTNKTYRWSGSQYSEISPSIGLGETVNTAYRGDRGKIAYDHSQIVSGNPHKVTKSEVGLSNVDNTSDINKPVSTAQQEAINTAISNIQTEGLNLLSNTRNFGGYTGGTGASLLDETYEGLTIAKLTVVWQYYKQSFTFEEGVTYCFSVYAKADQASTGIHLVADNLYSYTITQKVALDWTRYDHTFTASKTITTTIGVLISGVQEGKTMYVCGYKLTSNKAKGWSPNPFDRGMLELTRVLVTDTPCTYVSNVLTFGSNPRVILTNGTVKNLTLPNLTLPTAGYNDVYIDTLGNNVNAVASSIDKTQYLNTDRYLWIGWAFGTTGTYGFPKLILQ